MAGYSNIFWFGGPPHHPEGGGANWRAAMDHYNGMTDHSQALSTTAVLLSLRKHRCFNLVDHQAASTTVQYSTCCTISRRQRRNFAGTIYRPQDGITTTTTPLPRLDTHTRVYSRQPLITCRAELPLPSADLSRRRTALRGTGPRPH